MPTYPDGCSHLTLWNETCQFVHISSNVRFKSRQLRKNIIANVQRLFLALRHALKQSCHRSVAWSIKLCWLLTTFQSDSASAHRRPSLVSDKRVSVSVGVFRLWCTGVVFMQLGVKVNGVLYITVVCILCVLINDYCDVLLFKQLLPDICQAAGDFCFPAHHACARALSCCDTRLRTSYQTWPPNRPDFSSVDYRLLTVIQECVCEKQQEMSNIVDELWLLTEWHFFINWMTYYISQGMVESRNAHKDRCAVMLPFCCKFTSVSVCQK